MTPSPELLALVGMASALLGLCLLAGWEWLRYWRANRRIALTLGEGWRAVGRGWVKANYTGEIR